MNNKGLPSHVAVLVPSARKAADYLKQFDFKIGNEDRFEGVGTLEIYIEYGKSNSLLLMEAIGAGPYQRALEKRGPGLHHLAIDIQNIESFIDSISGSGWLIHPRSFKTIKHKTVYLARPGFPCLIEVQQKDKLENCPLFVKEIGINFDSQLNRLVHAIGLNEVVRPSTDFFLMLNHHKIQFKDLI